MNESKYSRFHCPIGELVLVGNDNGISRLLIENGTKTIVTESHWQRDDDFFNEAKQQIDDYFSGERQVFSLQLNPIGTDFQQRVWQALCEVPCGETRSYGQIAYTIDNPKAARAVGLANNRNAIPLLIPCHRIIGANGDLTGYAYGLELKRWLLEFEAQGAYSQKTLIN